MKTLQFVVKKYIYSWMDETSSGFAGCSGWLLLNNKKCDLKCQ